MSTAAKPVCKTVGPWLKDNLGPCLGGLTGQDWPALKSAVHIVELWCASDSRGRRNAEIAFGAVVSAMQPNLRRLAYHAIAHVADWSHRDKLWQAANLEPLDYSGLCKYERGGSERPL